MKFILKANYFGIHLQRTVTPLEQLSNTLVAVELSVVGMALRIQRTKKKNPSPAGHQQAKCGSWCVIFRDCI